MNPEEHLRKLFVNARQSSDDLPSDFGFETRLLASLRQARQPSHLLGFFVWRLLPVFAALTLTIAIYTQKSTAQTDLTGIFLGENTLVELLAN